MDTSGQQVGTVDVQELPGELAYQAVDPQQCVAQFGNWVRPTYKHADDFHRYRTVLDDTKPEVVVECGTHNGESARWFAQWGECDVITVDVRRAAQDGQDWRPGPVVCLVGDSTDPAVFADVRELVAGRRCMVSLDSDHSRAHVLREIELYRQLVTPGCHLVVEDGVLAWITEAQRIAHACHYDGNPLQAIVDAHKLGLLDGFSRDLVVEQLTRVSMFPVGWWRRDG
jgi:cephalosporin hydroxylase